MREDDEVMQRPNPLADPFLRRSFFGTAVTSVMVTGIYVTVAATWPTATTAWTREGGPAGIGWPTRWTPMGYRPLRR